MIRERIRAWRLLRRWRLRGTETWVQLDGYAMSGYLLSRDSRRLWERQR